ncbi:hypothetical protein B0A58_00090 [Flavobacterium branchiophilum NBRC 15030 = ATCC 35035]|uniref:Uncharacterized protein n=1 Tax=Flavobacterium branchiophilum TaxID=55197 RepID=A0A543G0F5_9FLAO|nr:hypothetical protein B0A58_00090 [Flavobacterium branchiophilum NBRC 15030 = ATCC 35035]TQM39572.1 hypothetical protein BC670_0373 [Flavobacterium branchiophilum]GEM56071.1 hypothetical protein FB1_22920 [Flavobacterium branchiophilum NBRC 15030 = ATCC 35035]
MLFGYAFKKISKLYLDENIQNTIVLIKDLQLTFFLIFLSYKLYLRRKRKEGLIKNLDIYKSRKIEYSKLFENGARDYILEQKENEEKLSNNESELKKLEFENEFIDSSILWLTIITCVIQIISFYGQKI